VFLIRQGARKRHENTEISVLSVCKRENGRGGEKRAPPHLSTRRGFTAVGPAGFEPATS
jgi:hypothetical protein